MPSAAYNARVDGSQHLLSKKIQLQQKIHTLLSPSLENMQEAFVSFVTSTDGEGDIYGRAPFCGTFENGKTWTALLHTNGVFDFREPPASSSTEKLRYAFVAASYSYLTPNLEFSGLDLVCHNRNARTIFNSLSSEDHSFIHDVLSKLFGVEKVRMSTNNGHLYLYVTESLGKELEVQHHGAALQKVLAMLTYFAALSHVKESRQFFLVDEIEAHLYPTIATALVNLLKDEAVARNIHVIITSVSQAVLELGSGLLCLSAEEPGHATLASLYRSLGHSKRRVIIVDGKHDVLF